MNLNLFRLALERLEHSDWAHFERLCSDFLSTELPSLRTMAARQVTEVEILSCSLPMETRWLLFSTVLLRTGVQKCAGRLLASKQHIRA